MSVYVPRNGERQYVARNGEPEFVAFHDNGDGTVSISPVYPNHFDLETGREYIAPPDCDCDGCEDDRRQAALYEQVQQLVRSALESARDLRWGAGEPVATVEGMVQMIGAELYPNALDPQPARRKSLSASVRRQVMERDGYRCQWPGCGTWIDLAVDHIIPVAKGGTNDPGNLQTLCRPHNSEKGVKVL